MSLPCIFSVALSYWFDVIRQYMIYIFFLLAGRRRPNMIGSIFLKNEKFSSSYPGVSNFSTNQNPAFYRCFQILGLGWGCKETGEVQVRCVVPFFCCFSVFCAQAVLAPAELQDIVIAIHLCYVFFPLLFVFFASKLLHFDK